jgi:hypothetical protein
MAFVNSIMEKIYIATAGHHEIENHLRMNTAKLMTREKTQGLDILCIICQLKNTKK